MPENIAQVLVTVIQVYSLVLLVRIILSWIPNLDRGNQLVDALYSITEPVLEPVRRAIPPMGGFDLSPLVVFFGLRILQGVLLNSVR